MKNYLFIFCIVLFSGSCKQNNTHMAHYEGQDISQTARIISDKNTKNPALEITTEDGWKIYSGKSVDSIDFSRPLLEGKGSGIFPLKTGSKRRTYFLLETAEGKAILADKHLPMAGGYNFRDMGGIKTKDGRFVKWGKIFRSDDLHNLTDDDLDYLSGIPIISIVDFRSEDEMKSAPDKVPSSVKKSYPYSIAPGSLNIAKDIASLTECGIDTIMMNINTTLVTEPEYIQIYRNFFALLQDDSNMPLLFHCSAGKDRTGMAAALILYALGVEEETIMQDYLFSNVCLGDKYAQYIEEYPKLKSLFIVKPKFIRAGIDQIQKQYGSVEIFLQKELLVDISKFREMYLY